MSLSVWSLNTYEIAHISQNRKGCAKVFPFPRVSPIKWEKVRVRNSLDPAKFHNERRFWLKGWPVIPGGAGETECVGNSRHPVPVCSKTARV